MALHKSEQVMAAIGPLLTGLTTTGANVKRSRMFAWETDNGITYEMGSEDPIAGEQQYEVIDWQLEVRITAHTKSVNPETELNLIKQEITVALKADYTLGGIARDIIEEGWSEPNTSGEANKPVTDSTGIFVVQYRRLRLDPGLP